MAAPRAGVRRPHQRGFGEGNGDGCVIPTPKSRATGRPHQRGVGEGDDDVCVQLVRGGAPDGPHGGRVARQLGHGHLSDRQAVAQHAQRRARAAPAQRVQLRGLLVQQVGHLRGRDRRSPPQPARCLCPCGPIFDLTPTLCTIPSRRSLLLLQQVGHLHSRAASGGQTVSSHSGRGVCARAFRSVVGAKLSISSTSARLRSGRGSKNTGWKPSSVSCSPAELASTASSSSPMLCARARTASLRRTHFRQHSC